MCGTYVRSCHSKVIRYRDWNLDEYISVMGSVKCEEIGSQTDDQGLLLLTRFNGVHSMDK